MIKVLVEDKGVYSKIFTFGTVDKAVTTLSDVISEEPVERISIQEDEIWLTINDVSTKHYITIFLLEGLESVDKTGIFSKLQEEFRCKLLKETKNRGGIV